MTPLSHSEAHEQLADLALEPAALEALAGTLDGARGGRDVDPLSAHIAICDDCRTELDSWRRLHGTVLTALDGPGGSIALADLAADPPVAAPASLRAAIAAIPVRDRPVASTGSAGRAMGPGQAPMPGASLRAGRSGVSRLAIQLMSLAAVIAVVILAGGLVLNQSRQLDQARADTAALASVTASLDRVILDPAHHAVALTAADGSTAGSVVWSSHDLVVLTTALAKPPADSVYRCWVERDGKRSPIGKMFFADGTGYWTGALDDWATTSFAAGSTFGISLEPVAGSTGSPAVLQAALGG